MILPPLNPGRVIRYSYLWYEKSRQGFEEGEYPRPSIVLQTFQEGDEIRVIVIPITHTPQSNSFEAVEIHPKVAKFLGLDSGPMWAVCGEANEFYWSGPDLRAVPGKKPLTCNYGQMPPGLFNPIRDRFLLIASGNHLRIVSRTE